MTSGSIFTVNPHLYAKMPFDTKKDFAPVTNVATGPMVVAVNATSDFKTLKELIAKAKAAPRSLNFGSAGQGSQVHMAAEKLAHAAGVDMVHVPYKGEAQAYNDLMAGQVQLVVGNIAAVSTLVAGGKLRALAVTSKERSPMMPEVPTVAEAGVPGFENTGWFGLMAPAGTPPEVIERIQRDTASVLASTEVKERLSSLGMAPVGNAPDELGRAIEAESRGWAEVVASRKLKIQ
jgi:tripartite-type tricarboxylate transporter receptor subunit TctC